MKITPIRTFQIGNSFPVESAIYGQFPMLVKDGFVILRVTGVADQISYGFLTMLYSENENVIRPHEQVIMEKVISKKEEALSESTFSKPVCLLYEPDEALTGRLTEGFDKGKSIARLHQGGALYEYAIHDNKRWAQKLMDRFARQKNLVIADGHHRTAAYFALRAENHQDPGLYSAILPLNQVHVRSYHRIFKFEKDQQIEFYHLLKSHFTIEEHERAEGNGLTLWPGLKRNIIWMFDHEKWKKLIPKETDVIRNGSADLLVLFQESILNPFCEHEGIQAYDIVRFVSGSELETGELQLTNREFLFLFPPVSREFLWSSSSRGEILPAKSTWIEPRIPSGVIEVPNVL